MLWQINGGKDIYVLLALITDEPKSREELMQALEGLDIERPALPAGLTEAGRSLSVGDREVDVTIKTATGPLHGLLYFSCWDLDHAFDVLGPIELK
ncbi:MAG: hypothetical protein V1755_04665 [Chloroflexota bacterium]